jgi:peptide/nickel transport system substrate-binding protein/oligopeptide transport system substrate-binding protein
MWADFQQGKLDCSQVPTEQVSTVAASPEVSDGTWNAGSWPAAALYFVGINMTDATLGASLDLRKAVCQSADAQTVVDDVSQGVAQLAAGYVPPGIPGHQDAQNPYPYDLEGATSALTTMGGAPTLNYWYDINADHARIADTLVTGWSQAGLTVKASEYEWGTFLEKLSRGNRGSGSQLFRVAWIADYPAMDAFVYPLFQSDQSPSGSYTFYSNKGVDDLLQKARATTDGQQRNNLYAQAEKLILTDMPAVPLYYYRYYRVIGPRVHGFAVDPMGTTDLRALWLE